MITPQTATQEMEHYSLTQASVCLAAGGNPSEPEYSRWLRGLCVLTPEALRRIEVGLAALAHICHDGFPWPLNFRSPEMIPLIRKYVANQEKYRGEMAARGESVGA